MPAAAIDVALDALAPLTPCAVVDVAVMQRNIDDAAARVRKLGVKFRPHVKTAKCLEAADRIRKSAADGFGGVCVSTLAEAAFFFREGGYTDVLYAVGFSAAKVAAVAPLAAEGLRLKVVLDHPDAARQVVAACSKHGGRVPLDVLIEVDSGDSRGGTSATGNALLEIAETLSGPAARTAGIALVGVVTHGGHSYMERSAAALRRVAREERDAVVHAATRLRERGHRIDIVSAGSTPTLMHAEDAAGLTELRAGVFVFQDLDQVGIGGCPGLDRIAMTVLTTVIGHTTDGGAVVDAGGLALSKDLSAAAKHAEMGAAYGLIVGEDDVCVAKVSQEHGRIYAKAGRDGRHGPVPGDVAKRFPIGARLRVLPNHACFTAAAYDAYIAVDGSTLSVWRRVNGWAPAPANRVEGVPHSATSAQSKQSKL